MAIAVPAYVVDAAKRGLKWNAEGKSGGGVTDKTLREAREMASGSVSEDKLRRMGPWFRRHRPDMDAPKNKPGNKEFPGAGATAWALWGGPTSGDIMRTAEWAESKVASLDREKSASASILLQTNQDPMPRFIVDIDGTLLDGDHQPIDRVIDYVEENAEEVVILTNRPESERAKTEAELDEADIEYDRLIMNPGSTAAPEFKAAEVKKFLDASQRVDLFIDNDASNREAVSALGVDVMDPADIQEQAADIQEQADDMEEQDDLEMEDDGMAKAGLVSNHRKLKMTIEDKLATAELLAQALTSERDDLRATVEKLTVGAADELTAAKADIVTKDAKLSELAAALEASAKEAEALKAKVAELEAAKVSASKEAAKIAASVGVAPTAIIPGSEDTAAKKDVLAEYNAITDPKAKADFFAKNAQAIYASIKV